MPLTTIDIKLFEEKGNELVKKLNSSIGEETYNLDCVELIQSVKDYKDGQGLQLISCIAIRNPLDGLLDLYLDMVGTPEEAITLLIGSIEKMVETGAIIKPAKTKDSNLN